MTNLDLGYDALGNLTSKSDVGSYSYDATKKHAVVSAGSNTYSYDANGNVTNRSGSTVLWTSYDLPFRIYGPDVWTHLHYGPNRQLWQQVTTTSGVAETTTYVGELIEKVNESGVTTWKHYVEAPTGTAAVYLRRSDGTADTYYLTHDHLGSIDKVLNAAGGVVTVAESFTALGARRGSDWQGLPTAAELAAIAATTRAGFTGHDMLDSVGLIHMRGRVYDPLIGRFLSVDPRVRDITAVQSWNGYGYVEGRALSATDPSGFELEEIFVDSTRLRSCVNSFDVGCGGDVEQRFGFDLRTPGYRDLLYDPGSFTEPGREQSETQQTQPQPTEPLCPTSEQQARPRPENSPTRELTVAGAFAGGLYGFLRGAAYGFRIAAEEAKYMGWFVRVLATSEAVYAGGIAGGSLGGPAGAVAGLGAGLALEAIPYAEHAYENWRGQRQQVQTSCETR